MFSKPLEGESAAPGRAAVGGRSQLSADLRIQGNLTSTGVVEIMGEVQGDIDAKTIVVGAEGRVAGKLRAETVEVRGNLSGSASCQSFTMRSSAVAQVTVTYETLVIESGAEIDGKFKHATSKA